MAYALLWCRRALQLTPNAASHHTANTDIRTDQRNGTLQAAVEHVYGIRWAIYLVQLVAAIVPLGMAWARVRQKRHTWAQCLVGLGLGVVLAMSVFPYVY